MKFFTIIYFSLYISEKELTINSIFLKPNIFFIKKKLKK